MPTPNVIWHRSDPSFLTGASQMLYLEQWMETRTDMAEETQTAYAKSMFSDPTNIAAAVQVAVGVLALPEVIAVIPLRWMPV